MKVYKIKDDLTFDNYIIFAPAKIEIYGDESLKILYESPGQTNINFSGIKAKLLIKELEKING